MARKIAVFALTRRPLIKSITKFEEKTYTCQYKNLRSESTTKFIDGHINHAPRHICTGFRHR